MKPFPQLIQDREGGAQRIELRPMNQSFSSIASVWAPTSQEIPRMKTWATLLHAAPNLLAELIKAETFIAGFEGDETQEGITKLLSEIRAAIAKATKVE